MVICHCEVVTDATLRSIVAEGATDVDEITERCGATGRCGGCLPAVEDLLAEAALASRDLDALLARQAGRRQLTSAA